MEIQKLLKTTLLIFFSGILIIGISAMAGETVRGRVENTGTVKSASEENKNSKNKPSEEKELKEKDKAEEFSSLSEFETVADSDDTRNQNLETACRKINGTEIKPGEIFSFNDTIGPCTVEEGYVNGPVITGGTRITEELGGGVCQVATTLYNAVLLGDIQIEERHRHSFPVDYVEVGLDAVVASPEKDFKFKNNQETNIKIEAFSEDGYVKIRLMGTEPEEKAEIRVKSIVKNKILPEGEEVKLTTELEPGQQEVLQEARTGYTTEVYREYYKDGVKIKEELITTDTYPVVNRIVLEGSKKSK